jgi:hypothetical protein
MPLLCTELEAHLKIADKTVAEFIIDTAREQKDVDQFKKVCPAAHSQQSG